METQNQKNAEDFKMLWGKFNGVKKRLEDTRKSNEDGLTKLQDQVQRLIKETNDNVRATLDKFEAATATMDLQEARILQLNEEMAENTKNDLEDKTRWQKLISDCYDHFN